MNVYFLDNVHYEMQLNGGCKNDIWRIYGNISNHPRFNNGETITISTPKNFIEEDEENGDMIIETISGSIYIVINLGMNKEKFIEQIKKDILSGEYEYH